MRTVPVESGVRFGAAWDLLDTPPAEGGFFVAAPGEPVRGNGGDAGYEASALAFKSVGVATLTRRTGIAVDAAGCVIDETLEAQRHRDPRLERLMDLWVGEHDTRLSDVGRMSHCRITTPTLFTNAGPYCVYGHVLFETLCSAYALLPQLQSGRLRLLLPPSDKSWAVPMLRAIGVPSEAMFQIGFPNITFDHLIVSSSCSGRQTFAPQPLMRDMIDELKRRHPAGGTGRRLYLTRAGAVTSTARRLENEDEVESLLRRYDFETLEPGTLSFAEQIRLFSEAECVVGLHGSALANTAFMPPGAAVVDIIPELEFATFSRWTQNIARLFGLRWQQIVTASKRDGRAVVASVDLEALEAALVALS